MPPLNTRRSRRRTWGLVATAGLAGALWGPVGPAEAGVSAGSTATASFGTSSGASAVTTGSLIGTGPATKKLTVLQAPTAQRLSCSPTTYTTSFTTSLGSGWSSLAARSQPCTGSSANGTWGSGSFKVTAYTSNGEFICRGGSYGYGSSYWYKTSKGWSWSGGTSDPIWNRNC